MNLEETQKFLRHWLLLLGAACVWFAWDSRYVRNIWFMAMVGMGVVWWCRRPGPQQGPAPGRV